jgi:ubiquinone/menaquinone biosynthesis C-methylase UbiE
MTLARIRARRRRRTRVGMAYDMAIEIARHLPSGARVLDVGCGSGFIAHHLSALLGATAHGADRMATTEAPIIYRSFDGETLPFDDRGYDAVLFCYVLHHARDAEVLLGEAQRVLRPAGRIVIYEDTPRAWIDRFLCYRHEWAWRRRTGPCTFRRDEEWRWLFGRLGLRVLGNRRLSRWRDPGHPVARSFYLLEAAAVL